MNTITKLNNGTITAQISSLGAQLLSLNDGTTEYMWQADKNVWDFTAPVLFPICGSVPGGTYSLKGKAYELPAHGFARFKEFEPEHSSDTKVCYLLKADAETKKQYPFDFEFRVKFALFKSTLHITYSVTNPSDEKMYFSFGGHEGYACPEGAEEYFIKFENDTALTRHMLDHGFLNGKTEQIHLDNNILNLDYREFGKCTYIFRNLSSESVILAHKSLSRKIRIGFDGHTTLAIWTLPGRKYVCIEPWCGVPQAPDFNGDLSQKDGIVALNGGQCFERTHFIEVL